MTYRCILQSKASHETDIEPLNADNINEAAQEALCLLRRRTDVTAAHVCQNEARILTLRPSDAPVVF